jgi:hypothetical protein
MSRDCAITQHVRETQERIFRLAQRDHGLTLKAIALDSGIPYGTLRTYAGNTTDRATAEMSASAIRKLTGIIPAELLSLLLPDGFAIVRVPEEVDHDTIETLARDYLAAKGKAHRPDSPGGRELASCESNVLDLKAAALRAAA